MKSEILLDSPFNEPVTPNEFTQNFAVIIYFINAAIASEFCLYKTIPKVTIKETYLIHVIKDTNSENDRKSSSCEIQQ